MLLFSLFSNMECDTCKQRVAQHQCAQCKHFKFCSEACLDSHPYHDQVCWDSSSDDPLVVGEALFSVLPLAWDAPERWDIPRGVQLCMTLAQGDTSDGAIRKAHAMIESIVVGGDYDQYGSLKRLPSHLKLRVGRMLHSSVSDIEALSRTDREFRNLLATTDFWATALAARNVPYASILQQQGKINPKWILITWDAIEALHTRNQIVRFFIGRMYLGVKGRIGITRDTDGRYTIDYSYEKGVPDVTFLHLYEYETGGEDWDPDPETGARAGYLTLDPNDGTMDEFIADLAKFIYTMIEKGYSYVTPAVYMVRSSIGIGNGATLSDVPPGLKKYIGVFLHSSVADMDALAKVDSAFKRVIEDPLFWQTVLRMRNCPHVDALRARGMNDAKWILIACEVMKNLKSFNFEPAVFSRQDDDDVITIDNDAAFKKYLFKEKKTITVLHRIDATRKIIARLEAFMQTLDPEFMHVSGMHTMRIRGINSDAFDAGKMVLVYWVLREGYSYVDTQRRFDGEVQEYVTRTRLVRSTIADYDQYSGPETGCPTPSASKGLIQYGELQFGKELGRGAFGVVYAGTYRGQPVAIKTIQGAPTQESLKEFNEEANLLAGVPHHPNVVQFIGITQSPVVLVTELVDGGGLDSRLKPTKGAPVVWTDVLRWSLNIAAGIEHLHRQGILHRDLATRNVLVDKSGTAKVTDFGLSVRVCTPQGPDLSFQQRAYFRGPYKWMPPESLSQNVFSYKSDTWAYGVTVWEILSRRAPFEYMDIEQVKQGVLNRRLRLPFAAKWPAPLSNLMAACWRTLPKDRPNMDVIQGWLKGMLRDPAVLQAPLPAISDQEVRVLYSGRSAGVGAQLNVGGFFDDVPLDMKQYIATMLYSSAADMDSLAKTDNKFRRVIENPVFWEKALHVRGFPHIDALRARGMDDPKWLFITGEAVQKILEQPELPVSFRYDTDRRVVFSNVDYGIRVNFVGVSADTIYSYPEFRGIDLKPITRIKGIDFYFLTVTNNLDAISSFIYKLLREGYSYVDRVTRKKERLVRSSMSISNHLNTTDSFSAERPQMDAYYDELVDGNVLLYSRVIPMHALLWSHYAETGEMLDDSTQLIEGLVSNAKKLLTQKGRNEILSKLESGAYDDEKKLKGILRDAKIARKGFALVPGKTGKDARAQLDEIIQKIKK